ncbi:hypothetical protein IWQ56_002570 [Coemansia nantahalensis]|nr:hypothetical protein IWQ56_002570 [Coemansia nantahalensis]
MNSDITNVEGCAFTTEELQRFHRFYKLDWDEAGLAAAPLPERIRHFVSSIDPDTDSTRLQAWLRTMGIIDEGEKSDAAKLYEQFEQFDFASAPGFSQRLADVYGSDDVSKHGIGERMDMAKAAYYNEHVAPLDYAAYKQFKESSAPRPVCPYQHLWDAGGTDKEQPDTAKFAHVMTIDIGESCAAGLTLAAINGLRRSVKEACQEKYYAAAVINSSCNDPANAKPVFLPALDASGDAAAALRAAVQLAIDLRTLNGTKPLLMLANGTVDASALGILLSTSDVVTSEMFAIDVAPNSESSRTFPFVALCDWARLSSGRARAEPGTAEYILTSPDLVLRSSEWMPLGLEIGFVAHRRFAAAVESILLAASCPPPHTRDALRKACAVESAYPGPSKISAWTHEIRQHFSPLVDTDLQLDELYDELARIDTPWARRHRSVVGDAAAKAVAGARIAGLQAMRGLEYSQALALELAASIAWTQGESATDQLFHSAGTQSLAEVLLAGTDECPGTSQAPEEPAADAEVASVPDECPFARMYRKNPSQFAHIDLQSITKHRSLNL